MSQKQEYHIRHLPTRNVVLFPTRAQIIRDIKDVHLQPGQNQVVIHGLSPTIDEHSVKVEGTSAATISEVTIDLLPNRDDYHDVYPSANEGTSDTSSEGSESESDNEPVKTTNKEIKRLEKLLIDKKELINSCTSRLRFIDLYGHSLTLKRPEANE